jgi:carbon-monoxide dehydrogenase medium subunit
MEIADFSYHRPATLTEACQLASRLGEGVRFLAGGTELLVDLKSKRDTAEHLVSLRDVHELRRIREDTDGLHIGAMASLAEVAESPAVARGFLALREAILTMGGAQIRNQATIGGNFCRAVSCADTPPLCLAAGARLRLVRGEGERILPAEEFFVGPRQTVLQPGEVLVEIHLPPLPAATGASYQRFSLRSGMAVAVAAVAALIRLDGERIGAARVVLGAVAPVPLIARACTAILADEPPSAGLFARAGMAAAAEAQPITDIRGSKAYRRELVEILTIRALHAATARAREERT